MDLRRKSNKHRRRIDMKSTKSLARTAGILYLVVGVFGGFSEYVRNSVTVAGDVGATASRVVEHATLLRVGVATDLVDFTAFLAVGLILYTMLKPVDATAALAMLVVNAVSVAMQALNMLNQVGALLVATHPAYATGMTSLMFLELHRQGYLIAQVFFGGYLVPLGYLVYRSGMFPRALGIVLATGGAAYLAGVIATYLSSSLDSSAAVYFGLGGGLAEVAFLLWLLIFGANDPGVESSAVRGGLQWSR